MGSRNNTSVKIIITILCNMRWVFAVYQAILLYSFFLLLFGGKKHFIIQFIYFSQKIVFDVDSSLWGACSTGLRVELWVDSSDVTVS